MRCALTNTYIQRDMFESNVQLLCRFVRVVQTAEAPIRERHRQKAVNIHVPFFYLTTRRDTTWRI